MTDTNANMSVLEYERLTAERNNARLARKAVRRARYHRRYARIGGRGHPLYAHYGLRRMVAVPCDVTITVNILPGSTVAYGTPAITRDDLT
jgi:hypothetical protein